MVGTDNTDFGAFIQRQLDANPELAQAVEKTEEMLREEQDHEDGNIKEIVGKAFAQKFSDEWKKQRGGGKIS